MKLDKIVNQVLPNNYDISGKLLGQHVFCCEFRVVSRPNCTVAHLVSLQSNIQ
jgi:hypothetical protein